MYAINLPWEQSNDLLLWAIQEKAHLRVTVRMGREWMEMPSEFLTGELLKTLTVRKFQAPWTERMLAGQLLPCSFRKGHRKYLFVSAVLECVETKVNDQTEEAFVLAWPEGIQQVQRRLYFRAAIPSDMNLNVRIWHSVPAIDAVAPATPPLANGRLVDISAGGAQIEMDSPEALTLDKSYLLEIEMPKPENPILVQVQARRVQAVGFTDMYRFGVQFLSLDHSPKGQETLLRLARFTNYLRSLLPAENLNSDY